MRKNSGPSWGGNNWRLGKEEGTWFRHSEVLGPIVHHGEYILIVQKKRRVNKTEYEELILKDRAEKRASEKVVADKQEAEELIEKKAIVARLVEETKVILTSPGWTVLHRKSWVEKKEGIQTLIYGNNRRNGGSFWAQIEWTLCYKGCPVWIWSEKKGWEAVPLSVGFEAFFGNSAFFIEIARKAENEKGREMKDVGVLANDVTYGTEMFDLPTFGSVYVTALYADKEYSYVISKDGVITRCFDRPARIPHNPSEPHTKYDGCDPPNYRNY